MLVLALLLPATLPVAAQDDQIAPTAEEDQLAEPPAADAPAASGDNQTPGAEVAAGSPSATAAVSRAGPSVVQLIATDKSGKAGSAVRVAQGVLTNEHVIRGVSQLDVVRADSQRASATVVACDATLDLALLDTDLDLPTVELAPARSRQQGSQVFVLGYPRPDIIGGQVTVTSGILSAVREDDKGTVLLQTDAAMNAGNSGGGIVDGQGSLLAISAFGIRQSEGLNFGIATESIQSFLDRPDRRCNAPSPTPTPATAKGPGTVLVSDNFQDETRGVLPRTTTDPGSSIGYVEGEYAIAYTRPSDGKEIYVRVPGDYDNVSIAVDVRIVRGSLPGVPPGGPVQGPAAAQYADSAAVVLECKVTENSGYAALVRPLSGRILLLKTDPQRGTVQLMRGDAPGINKGTGKNHLELSCGSDRIVLSANGTELTSIRENSSAKGSVYLGYWLDKGGTGEVRFNNLVVTQR